MHHFERSAGFNRHWAVILTVVFGVLMAMVLMTQLTQASATIASFAPGPSADGDWPQLGHDTQRTNYTPLQVNPPYCYTWKWYEAPIASRAQPVVVNGRLFVGDMNGVFYARNATTGASLWTFNANSPIRHSAGVMSDTVVFSTHDGFTYALDVTNGSMKWKTSTGSSSTAPLMDVARGRVVVASSSGKLTTLNLSNGGFVWEYDSGAPILTSPSLSVDGQLVFVGNEAIYAIAVNANNGAETWRTRLQGQSLADRYPVVTTDTVIYRSQPLYFFHTLLHEGDATMDQAGAVNPNWSIDWANVKPNIINYLTASPAKQTFFALDMSNGSSRGVAPVLYTYGNNDIPNTPVIRNGQAYVTYRARHGIQTDAPTVHVSSEYDAELGDMNLSTLDIVGLTSTNRLDGSPQFRLTSDEPAVMTMGGNTLWVDNWERLGGISLTTNVTGQLVAVGAVSNDWPECDVQCGPGTNNPFFPLSGNSADPAYPFPSPRVTDGHVRGGVVIANNMIYWHVIEGGLAGIAHRSGGSCPAPLVYTQTLISNHVSLLTPQREASPWDSSLAASHTFTDYVSLDLTAPIVNPPTDLVQRLRDEVRSLVTANEHLMPFYLERGFSTQYVWPYDTDNPPGLPSISYAANGNAYWHDPGELLYTLALAYPYLDAQLKISVTQFMSREMNLYPPLENLPYGDSNRDWLKKGTARERYNVPMRNELNNWPPAARSMSALYALWLWSKNTGDWSYAQSHWSEVTNLFNDRRANMTDYYSDIAGAIGYARLAQHFGNSAAYNDGVQAAVGAMQAGTNITTYINFADNQYLDPRSQPTGWYLPVFYGMTPEVGLYLREQTNGVAQSHIASREDGDGLRWWYLTRAGAHAEVGETSYVAPIAAWSHFLAHAYIDGDAQETLRSWLDRPWGRADLYSLQKIVATIHAQPLQPNLSASAKMVSSMTPRFNEAVTYTIALRNQGKLLTETFILTDALPIGLSYVSDTLNATSGAINDNNARLLRWSGVLNPTPTVTITYRTVITETIARVVTNNAVLDAGSAGSLNLSAMVLVNARVVYLPLIRK